MKNGLFSAFVNVMSRYNWKVSPGVNPVFIAYQHSAQTVSGERKNNNLLLYGIQKTTIYRSNGLAFIPH